jgi:hypothetical protein
MTSLISARRLTLGSVVRLAFTRSSSSFALKSTVSSTPRSIVTTLRMRSAARRILVKLMSVSIFSFF